MIKKRELKEVHDFLDKHDVVELGILGADDTGSYTIFYCKCGEFFCRHAGGTELEYIEGLLDFPEDVLGIEDIILHNKPEVMSDWRRYKRRMMAFIADGRELIDDQEC